MLGDQSIGFRRDPQSVEPRVWLAWAMRRHGQAAHQEEIARWLARGKYVLGQEQSCAMQETRYRRRRVTKG